MNSTLDINTNNINSKNISKSEDISNSENHIDNLTSISKKTFLPKLNLNTPETDILNRSELTTNISNDIILNTVLNKNNFISSGAFGNVYKIKIKNKIYALKIVEDTTTSNTIPEFKITNLIKKHCLNSIVTFYNIFYNNNTLYILMEKANYNLRQLINKLNANNMIMKLDVHKSLMHHYIQKFIFYHNFNLFFSNM